MACIVAFIVLGVMSIFSASHRELAREAAECVFRRISLRPCQTGFNEKIKGVIVGRLVLRSPASARFLNRYFELLAWIFMILTIGSLIWTGRGVYNWWNYGSCNGLNASGFCVFDPTGANNQITSGSGSCGAVEPVIANLKLSAFKLDEYPRLGDINAKHQIVFVGCYSCQYTRQTYPLIRELMTGADDASLVYIHFPVKPETAYLTKYAYCAARADGGEKFWRWNDALFAADAPEMTDEKFVSDLLTESGYDAAAIKNCVESQDATGAAARWHEQAKNANIFGTPTIFIDGRTFVGPKPKRVYNRALGKWW